MLLLSPAPGLKGWKLSKSVIFVHPSIQLFTLYVFDMSRRCPSQHRPPQCPLYSTIWGSPWLPKGSQIRNCCGRTKRKKEKEPGSSVSADIYVCMYVQCICVYSDASSSQQLSGRICKWTLIEERWWEESFACLLSTFLLPRWHILPPPKESGMNEGVTKEERIYREKESRRKKSNTLRKMPFFFYPLPSS